METGDAVGADAQLTLWPDVEPERGDSALARIERREREVAAIRACVAERTRALIDYLVWRWRIPRPAE